MHYTRVRDTYYSNLLLQHYVLFCILIIERNFKHIMTKEELTKKEAELTEKENGLNERENKLNERENGLNEREEHLNDKKADADEIVKSVKAEYEDKLLKQHDKYEERITERNKVIKQLLAGNGDANEPKGNPIIDKINAQRTAQLKKW